MIKKITPKDFRLQVCFLILLFAFSSVTWSQTTVSKTFNPGTSVTIDGCGTYCTNTGLLGVTFTTMDFPDGKDIMDVNVEIRWAKTDGTCSAPLTGNSFHSETSFRLDSPSNPSSNNVILAPPSTWTGTASISAVTTTFDQAAGTVIGGANPVSGTFLPNTGNLNDFNNTSALGDWYLRAGDSGVGDPLCVVYYTVIITADDLTDPVVSCPADVTISYCADTTPTSTGIATATDDITISPMIGFSDVVVPGTGNEYVITRTWTGTDARGNIGSCDQIITVVEDVTAPVAVSQNPILVLDAMGNATLTPADVDNGSTDDCNTPFLAFETTSFAGETTMASPTDELGIGAPPFPYEASAFTVPTSGTYTFNGTGAMPGGGFFIIIWNDTPIPNSGIYSARPEFLSVTQINNDGSIRTGPNAIALVAGKTYYMSIGDFNIGLGSYSITLDMPIRTTAATETYNCRDIGNSLVTLYAFDAAGNTDSAAAAVTVDGTLTTYAAGAWNNGAPNLGSRAVVDELLVSGGTSIEACSCDISSTGNLVLETGDYLLVDGDITVAVGGSLTVDNGASVVQIDDAAAVTNNGFMLIKKQTPVMAAKSFMVSGSPMTAETREGVFGSSYIVRNHVTGNFIPNPDVEIVSPGINNWADDNGNNWLTHTGLLNPGAGYMVFPQLDGSSSGTYLQAHSLGTLNNGIVNFNLGFNADQNSSPNILANPYASAIDAEVFFDDPANSGIDVLYFWEHITPLSITYPGYNVANFSMGDISMYSEAGGGLMAANGGATPTQYVASGQGFGVKPTASGIAQFKNAMRVTGNNDSYRNNDPIVNRDRLWLNVYNETYGLGSTTLIAFTENTSDVFVNSEDVKRLATPVSLYSELDSEEQLAINALGAFEVEDVVYLGFSTQVKETQNYRISIHDLDGVNMTDATVYLIDALTGTVTNLSEGDYTFQSGEAVYSKRFKVVFESSFLAIEDNAISNVSLYPNPTEGQLNIASPNAAINSVAIFDLQGRKVANEIFSGNNQVQINISDLNSSVYFVTVNTDAGTVTKRLIKK